MEHRFLFRIFNYFLCFSFFLLTTGFSTIVAEAREIKLPIGEMVSRGEVKFEARERVWKNVEPSHFPVFQGLKIKTEKGGAIISLANNNQIEVGQNSVVSFDQKDRLHLFQGRIDFRISSPENISFKVGNLIVVKTPSLQAAQKPALTSQKYEAAIGAIFVRPNGGVTIQSTQGQLTILNQERIVLAAVSSKESLTIPSTIVEKPPAGKTPPGIMIAQVGDTEPAAPEGAPAAAKGASTGGFSWGWGAVGLAFLGIGGILAASGGGGGGGPVCP
jgi:hypothetical protein